MSQTHSIPSTNAHPNKSVRNQSHKSEYEKLKPCEGINHSKATVKLLSRTKVHLNENNDFRPSTRRFSGCSTSTCEFAFCGEQSRVHCVGSARSTPEFSLSAPVLRHQRPGNFPLLQRFCAITEERGI